MARLISALGNPLDASAIPDEIVYIPEGKHRITPKVDGKAQTIFVKVTPENGATVAASLQSDLEKRMADNVRPIIDFDHSNTGPAAALPTAFRYEAGKGIMCALDWTDSGRRAVEGRDFSYFSPTFLIGDDGTPAGLPERGPLGALVNNPAFREIPRIAAADASADIEHQDPTPMSKLVFAALGIDPAHSDAETSAVQKIEASAGRIKELEASIADLTKERDKLKADSEKQKAEAADARKERAKTLVEAAVADGRIAPKDEDTKTFYTGLIEAGNANAEAQLSKLPKQHPGIDKPLVNAGQGEPEKKEETPSPYARVEAAFAAEIDAK